MNSFLLLSMIISAISAVFAVTRQLQMLQQSSYFPSRYYGWVRDSFSGGLFFSALVYLIISVLYNFKIYIAISLLVTLSLILRIPNTIKLQKKSIKKLVFTGRIKRLYAAVILLFAVLISVYCLAPQAFIGRISALLTLLLSTVTPILTFVVWLITTPIEKIISNGFVKDAKNILASYQNLTVIGITGSYGKTTTKFILTRILSEKFNVVCTPHSYNTPMGVVRTIREMLKPQTQIFVCEMGAKNVGDIEEICNIASPNYGLITSVGAQHLETFKSIDNVYKTKFELADAVAKNGGITFVNGDSKEILDRLNTDCKIYGTNNEFDFCGTKISYGRNGSEFNIKLGDEDVHFTTKLLGLHSIIDIIGAISLAYTLGVPAADIQYAVASLKPTEHRLQLKSFTAGSLLIDDAYNANPEGCLEAVRVLGSFDGMKKVIVTPGLIELGEKEYECNYSLGLEASKNCDTIILVGTNRSKPMADAVKSTDFPLDNLHIVASFKDAMEIYSKIADNNTVVLFENDLPDNYLY